jgi:mannose/fructose/N-acetylgalactosamine-specific phosphotransferase system component IIB
MPIRLCRIDDRLIHGQVALGWARSLDIADIVLVDDEVAASPWEQDLYRMAVPPELQVEFMNTEQARQHLPEWQRGDLAVLVLTGSIGTMARLLAGVPHPPAINLGGIHHRDGRTERLPYLYLTDEELRELQRLQAAGIEVSAEDVPGGGAVSLEALA